ncbi:MAG: YchJ family metal-binding protein [Acidimicrobiales bacterium]
MTSADLARCPCGSGLPYGECCGRFHRGEAEVPTAERLMRARYAAYVIGDGDYLLRSWHPSSRPAAVSFDPEMRWQRLEILDTADGGIADQDGTVEFIAHYERGHQDGALHELSQFVRREGRWTYLAAVDAELS